MRELLIQPNNQQVATIGRHIQTLKESLAVAAKAERKYREHVARGELPEMYDLDWLLWKDFLDHQAYQNKLIEQLSPYMRKQFAYNIYWLQDDMVPPTIPVGRNAFMLWLGDYHPTQYHWKKSGRLYLPVLGNMTFSSFGAPEMKKVESVILHVQPDRVVLWHP